MSPQQRRQRRRGPVDRQLPLATAALALSAAQRVAVPAAWALGTKQGMVVLSSRPKCAHPAQSNAASPRRPLLSLSSTAAPVACTSAAVRPRPGSSASAANGQLPLEVLEYIFSLLGSDSWSIGSCAQVCRQWRVACQAPSVWARARLLVRNPEWKLIDAAAPALRCFYALNDDARAKAVHFLTAQQQTVMRSLRLSRIVLLGPNILKEAAHLARLAQEAPWLEELVLVRCELSVSAVQVLLQCFPRLKSLVVSEWTSLGSLFQLASKSSLQSMVVHACAIVDRELLVYVNQFLHLQRIHVSGCPRLTMDTCMQLPQRFANLVIDHSFCLDDASRPYHGIPRLPVAARASSRSMPSEARPWDDASWWSEEMAPPPLFA